MPSTQCTLTGFQLHSDPEIAHELVVIQRPEDVPQQHLLEIEHAKTFNNQHHHRFTGWIHYHLYFWVIRILCRPIMVSTIRAILCKCIFLIGK